ncbi:MAG TPA: acetate--CoA ligase family protein [Rhodopila sp.]|uniref:acetate--CoA ligase family protein n=1 Tax=Rhodopila sp. TaxID=2480087 RepID=UPI002B9B025B|nr:acetate--CoA ligase family protein [Rhodopila sp.]HVY15732.1 acetate--CoA ligase family protein [Rhodopila sp.]
MPAQTATQDALDSLFHPRAVAVIGASDDTTKHGYIVLTNIRNTGFKGGIYGVSRRLRQIDGIPCVPDIAALPAGVDTAFLAIPAEAAVQAVRDCARVGMKTVIVGSAGYAESLDAGGAERQRELQAIAAQEGIRIVGPNCNGIYNAHLPLSVGFNTSHAKRQAAGGISIFSHSGALFDAMAGRLAKLGAGLSLFASAGNEADMSVLDYMEYGLTHAPTRVIALLIDSLDDGARFRRLALAAHAAGKHVVALKIGGSQAGAAAAVAHSSRMAGDHAAYRALFKACGVATVQTLEGFMTAAALLDKYGRCPGMLGALSTSGAGASLIADRCEALGVPLAPLRPETIAAIDAHKMFSRIGNPLDLGIFGGMRRSAEVPTLLMTDPDVSVTLALVHSMNPWQGDPYRAAMGAAREASGRPLLLVSPGGLPETELATYARLGIDVFTETDILLEGIGALLTPPPDDVAEPAPATASPLPDRALTEPESLRLLAEYGVPTVPMAECTAAAEAVVAAERLGFPVVLKGVAEGVAHKSDLGLVHVGLADAAAVTEAYAAVKCRTVVVQAMVRGELEAIAGVTRAEGVGLVLIAGLGGIFAEALHDVVTLPIPSSRAAIEAAVAAGSLGRVLSSPRWKHPGSLAPFVDVLMGLQAAALACGERLQAIDVNPVILGAAGAIAVDALVVPKATA